MSEAELERLLHNNRYHLTLPYVRRQHFETLPQMLARQVVYRCKEATKKYNMKQYTNSEQTAKLMELEFEKPKSIEKVTYTEQYGCGYEKAYSIGELIEMLPEALCTSHDDSCHYHLRVDADACMWRVRYMNDFGDTLFATYDVELINALCDMVIVAWAT